MIPLPLLAKLRALPWRLIGAVGLALLAWWQVSAYAERRADAREAEIRALWEADTAKRDKVASDAIAKAEADKAAALTRNQEIEHDYQSKLAAADAGRDDLERLLQRTRGEIRRGASREATSVTIALAAGEARRLEELRRLDGRIATATADLRVEAGKNADQLDAVLAEVGPQL